MSNIITIKHGNGEPNGKLLPYELGYRDDTGALYINNGDGAVQLANQKIVKLINSNNYLQLPEVKEANFKANNFLVSSSEKEVYYRTAQQVLSDIGAFSTNGGTISGDVIVNAALTAKDLLINGKIVLKEGVSYGNLNPIIANIPGVKGQIYFVLPE